MDLNALIAFLHKGGPALWVIAGLSVLTLALVLWKLWRLARLGAWARGRVRTAVALWCEGGQAAALEALARGGDLRARLAASAMGALRNPRMDRDAAREETTRVAKAELAELRAGLRALELIATIAPLIGLLGTVLGMIEAFQALQDSGAQADAAALAGGIWEALLTTAAGMAVAIPAAAALTWFESVAETAQTDLEDIATRIFTHAGDRGAG
ncbi:MotA/TolQ/ExbB proton channel family protein [Actibacterium sp. MT2.3-13A]|uniref:MotA/TolQ/ExbB proton channel family protein n=1 Tax=Actibacterium sp. MT2.3-13A TaxID=2828332 RepID=UPI001BA78818|nr:MotA/TolQ/ExbB proton channel family protein [Actibacterium sp. MT2.3-13A]